MPLIHIKADDYFDLIFVQQAAGSLMKNAPDNS
jgi:hypothetical protein